MERSKHTFKVVLVGMVLALGLAALFGPGSQAQSFHVLKNSTEPIYEAAAITPNDSTDLTNECRAIYVGGNGSIRLDAAGGATNILFSSAKGGSTIPVRVKRVRSTGTTANNLVCLY